jgi:hypothetical protein
MSGGVRGGVVGSAGSACGDGSGSKTISRSLQIRPFPFSFAAKGSQQPGQMSYFLPSISRSMHSFVSPQKSQTIINVRSNASKHSLSEFAPTRADRLQDSKIKRESDKENTDRAGTRLSFTARCCRINGGQS